MKTPFISIVMPIYNDQEYIQQSIESVLNQTFFDIELICVDDGSLDDSVAVINEYVKTDKRIRLLRHYTNMGTLKSRSDGVMMASGKYIMFLDADDELELYACEKLNQITKEIDADIYGFGTKIVCNDEYIQEQAQSYFTIYSGMLSSRALLEEAFINRGIPKSVCGKLWSSKLCKKVHEIIGDKHIPLKVKPVGEDSYAFLIMAFYATSFFGTKEVLYKYYYGRGGMSRGLLTLEQFEKICASAIVVKNCYIFLSKEEILLDNEKIVNEYGDDMLSTCINIWISQITEDKRPRALQIMIHYWTRYSLFKWVTDKWDVRYYLLYGVNICEMFFYLLLKEMRLIIYGAGKIGRRIYKKIKDSSICEVVLWVDKNYKSLKSHEMPINSPEEITKAEFDKILIAIENEYVRSSVKQYLIESLNIPENLII